ncbi:resolvase [Mesorhizobium helmanticense]|uniref:Resolvase n=1 Tax=Mesorhizobium helmanticense TaxID=1776423 RepID=A0A2T4ILX7_9HYPH|nr:resolvase [Mesorhizobium helmanticense]
MKVAIKLINAQGSTAEAARQLSLGRPTVYGKVRRLGISRPA